MHTKQGEVTKQGLAKGYIQASPFYPANSLHITMEDEIIYIKGKTSKGNKINKAFAKIKDAREYLYKTL